MKTHALAKRAFLAAVLAVTATLDTPLLAAAPPSAGPNKSVGRPVVMDAWTLTSGKADDTFMFGPLDPKTEYELELAFLTPGKSEIARLMAGGEVLAEKIPVESTRGDGPMPPARRWNVPPGAIREGRLRVQLQGLETRGFGKRSVPMPFAVHVRITASDPKAQALTAELPAKIEAPAVRLTPRPAEVAGVDAIRVDLNGTWQFSAAPPAEFWKLTQLPPDGWKTVRVPLELALQGFELKGDETVAYWREFAVPASWRGQRIKLKCDAIFNDARVWINGREAGTHVGCFTPFELDITELVKHGSNTIAIAVRVDEAVDKMAWTSQFAGHKFCGILRKIYLFAVPPVNVSDVYTLTTFDKDYRDATLTAKVQITNDSDQEAKELGLRVGLRGHQELTVKLPAIRPHSTITQEVKFSVPEPRKWDVEHPNLYDLSVELLGAEGGSPIFVERKLGQSPVLEKVARRVGFRDVQVRGNRVFINNMPVKYHGVVWHETAPGVGRSLQGDTWRRDMQLLRAMNCNYIRFQCVGGPPPEELIEACDEVGMFVEDELPVCWSAGSGPKALAVVLRAALEMVLADRSQPSVIQWSLGNEMVVDQNLLIAYRLFMKDLDSSRPYTTDGYLTEQSGRNGMPIDNLHYTPTAKFAEWLANTPIPILQGEWGHPASYNRREVYTDPGVRDIWGLGIADKWEKMYALQGSLGGSVWTGIDDIYFMPDGGFTGWGEYGLVDTWRRPKPEYWHFKKIFSPLHVRDKGMPMPAAGKPVRIEVENRHAFTDLKEVRFEWSCASEKGTARTSAPPGGKGVLEISLPAAAAKGGALELKAYNAEGVMLDAWRIGLVGVYASACAGSLKAEHQHPVELTTEQDRFVVRAGDTAWEIDRQTGLLSSATAAGKKVALSGPTLLVLPLSGEGFNIISGGRMPKHQMADAPLEEWVKDPKPLTAPCAAWKARSVGAKQRGRDVEFTVTGQYKEAAGQFVMRFSSDGGLSVHYDFQLSDVLMQHPATPAIAKDMLTVGIEEGKLRPRQLGLVFDLPASMDTLAWRRKAQWTYYPDEHIGRPAGQAKAFCGPPVCKNSPFYRQRPSWPWSHDCFPQGSNDFRSTKHNIYEASLTGGPESARWAVLSDGSQHVRAWIDGDRTRLLVADVSCEGCLARYFCERVLPSPQLKPGDHVRGDVRLQLRGR